MLKACSKEARLFQRATELGAARATGQRGRSAASGLRKEVPEDLNKPGFIAKTVVLPYLLDVNARAGEMITR